MQKPIFFVEICGGLGNQLFQLVALHALAKEHDTNALVLKSATSWSILFPRNVYWDSLFTKLQTTDKTPLIRYVHNDVDVIRGFEKIVFPLRKQNEESANYYVQLKGGYQHRNHFWKFLPTFIDSCLPDLTIRQSWHPLSTFVSKYNLDTNAHMAFLHIRRGDYKKLTHCHVVLPIVYYENAIHYFHSQTKFLVICEQEDLQSVKHDIQMSVVLRNRCVIDDQLIKQTPDYQQMYLMSMCMRGGMIANSTFSVWGGYLHQSKTGVFTYPDTFFAHEPNAMPNIFDPTWIRVSATQRFTLLKKKTRDFMSGK